jgi:hypothetical protein
MLGVDPRLDLRIDDRAKHECIPATSISAPAVGAQSGRWISKLTLFVA